jgi:hypothetical protein
MHAWSELVLARGLAAWPSCERAAACDTVTPTHIIRWYKVRNRSAQHTPFSVSSTQRDAGEAAVAELGDELGDGENGPGATGFGLAQRKWVVAVLVWSLGVGGLPAAKTAR